MSILKNSSPSPQLVEDLVPRLNAKSSKFGWNQIKELTKTSGVKNLEDFLHILPNFMKEQKSFFFDSRSFKSKSGLTAATPKRPRVVLANSDSSVLIAANTVEDSEELSQNIEIIVFDAATSTFQPKVIVFPKSKNESPQFVDNPMEYFPKTSRVNCGRCHGNGSNFRPIWDTYPIWPGAYGQAELESNYEQEAMFTTEVSKLFEPGEVLSGLITKELINEGSNPIKSLYKQAENGIKDIEKKLYVLNANRVIRMFAQSLDFKKLVAPLFIATSPSSAFEDHVVPTSTLERYQSLQQWVISQDQKHQRAKKWRVKNGSFPLEYTLFDSFKPDQLPSRLHYLGSLFDIQMDYIGLSFEANSMGLNGGPTSLLNEMSLQMNQVLLNLHPELKDQNGSSTGQVHSNSLSRIQEAYLQKFGIEMRDFLEQAATE